MKKKSLTQTSKDWIRKKKKVFLKMTSGLLKSLIKIFTSKDWRKKKRLDFFEEIFEDLKEDRSDGINHGTFSFIKSSGSTFSDSCNDLANNVSTNVFLNKKYKLNIGRAFGKYLLDTNQGQTYDYLYAEIKRISSIWKILVSKSGSFKVNITGKENGENFEFSYTKEIKFWTSKKRTTSDKIFIASFYFIQKIKYQLYILISLKI